MTPDKKKTPKTWSMLSSDNYKNLFEIILNQIIIKKFNTNYKIFLCNWLIRKTY